MSEPKVAEGKSVPCSAGGGAPVSEQIASLNCRAGHWKRLLTLKMKSVLTPNTTFSVLEYKLCRRS